LFWRTIGKLSNNVDESIMVSKWQLSGALMMLLASPLIALFGASIIDYTNSAAEQLHDIQYLIEVMKLDGDGL
jgi:multicomponent K+:H+ antiporter subunit D